MIEGFEERLADFIKKWQDVIYTNWKAQFDNDKFFKPLEVKKGRKYCKIVSDNSVCAFVDMNTGDVYKPAGWKAPAKHVRGNIFSTDNGMEAVSTASFIYSVRYLR